MRETKTLKEAVKRVGGKRGFTLIELLIVMVIISILIGGIIYSVRGFTRPAESTAYEMHTYAMHQAVLSYWLTNDCVYPVLDMDTNEVNGITYYTEDVSLNDGHDDGDEIAAIDMCALFDGGYFDEWPASTDGLIYDGGNHATTLDNCGKGTDEDDTDAICPNCDAVSGSYVVYWNLTDKRVFTCHDANHDGDVGDAGDHVDGYRGEWP